MSAALVRKSLAIVDSDFSGKGQISKKKKKNKAKQGELFKSTQKVSVSEIRKNNKTKEDTLKENLEKLELIRHMCSIDLDEEITKKFIERAVTKRPIRRKAKSKKPQETAFTEHDFAKFEKEYLNE